MARCFGPPFGCGWGRATRHHQTKPSHQTSWPAMVPMVRYDPLQSLCFTMPFSLYLWSTRIPGHMYRRITPLAAEDPKQLYGRPHEETTRGDHGLRIWDPGDHKGRPQRGDHNRPRARETTIRETRPRGTSGYGVGIRETTRGDHKGRPRLTTGYGFGIRTTAHRP